MHDIRFIRSNPEGWMAALLRRGERVNLAEILALDEEKRTLTGRLDSLRAQRNSVSKAIGAARKAGEDTAELEADMRRVGEEIQAGEARERGVENELNDLLLSLPNLPDASTPDGRDASANVTIDAWGAPPSFEFTPCDHLELGERLDILDFKRGAKVSGAGFPVWRGLGARLERALLNFLLDLQTKEHGYCEMLTPFVANRDSMLGSGQIPRLEEDMYHIAREDLFLIPTSEVTLINLHREETFAESSLPVKYAAYSPCFRREAGAYGHSTRGFQRVHQFNKVELVRFEKPEDSHAAWQEMIGHACEALRRLEIPFRVQRLCAGDLGFNAAACCDLEVWAPADGGRWLEVSSISNCVDFQARRAGIRYRPQDGSKAQFVHILNGSGLATSRLMVALLENHQTEEGSIAIPAALRPYFDGKSVITAEA